jgi:hypothetical protein
MPLTLAGAMMGRKPRERRVAMGSSKVAEQARGKGAYRVGIGIAVTTSLLTVWSTVVRDDGNGIGFFMVIMAAMVGGFAAWFRPAGLARTMVGVAIMQAMVGALIATAPVTANMPNGPCKALLFSGVFAVLWLISAAFFRAAAKRDRF